jgi:inorganic triphosphatase YgiF
MNAANNQTSLDLQKLANELGVYQSDLEYAAKKYGYDAELSMNSANNQAAMAQLLQELAAEERMNTANNTAARSQQYYENKYAQEQADREHQYALDLAKLKSQVEVDETVSEADSDTIARLVVEGIESGDITGVSDWDGFQSYLARYANVPAGEAKKLREAWAEIMPNLFG